MKRQWRWRDMGVAVVVALAAAGTAHADPVALPAPPAELQRAPLPAPPALPALPLPQAPALPPLAPAAPAPLPQAPLLPVPAPLPQATPAPVVPGAPPVAVEDGGTSSTSASSDSSASSSSSSSRASRDRAFNPEPSPRRLRRVLAPLAGCVATLGPRQEQVLVRRAGLNGYTGQSREELATSLNTSVTRVTRLERRGLRSLRRTARAGGCGAKAPAPAALPATRVSQPLPASDPAPAPDRGAVKGVRESSRGGVLDVVAKSAPKLKALSPAAVAASTGEAARSYADDHPVQFALAVFLTLLCALLLVRELRRDLRRVRF